MEGDTLSDQAKKGDDSVRFSFDFLSQHSMSVGIAAITLMGVIFQMFINIGNIAYDILIGMFFVYFSLQIVKWHHKLSPNEKYPLICLIGMSGFLVAGINNFSSRGNWTALLLAILIAGITPCLFYYINENNGRKCACKPKLWKYFAFFALIIYAIFIASTLPPVVRGLESDKNGPYAIGESINCTANALDIGGDCLYYNLNFAHVGNKERF